MKPTKKLVAAGVIGALAIGGAIAGITVANASGGEDGGPITGDAYDRASAAALEHTGGGTVTETEVGDEESYYEVEVTMPDGRRIDVQLDRDFRYVSQKADGDGDETESND